MSDLITGAKVSLLPITMEDTDLIVKWRNNPNVQHNFVFRETFTSEMHKSWMDTKVATGKVVQFIIQDNESKKKVGSVYLRDIDKKFNSAEYGVFIGEDGFRGKGLGSEAAKLIVEYGFLKLNLHRIFLRVFEHNTIAIASYEKAGFKVEGTAKDMVFLDDRYHNMVFMSMINNRDSK